MEDVVSPVAVVPARRSGCPRRGRDSRPRTIHVHVAAAASPRPVSAEYSTSRPRRRRDSSRRNFRAANVRAAPERRDALAAPPAPEPRALVREEPVAGRERAVAVAPPPAPGAVVRVARQRLDEQAAAVAEAPREVAVVDVAVRVPDARASAARRARHLVGPRRRGGERGRGVAALVEEARGPRRRGRGRRDDGLVVVGRRTEARVVVVELAPARRRRRRGPRGTRRRRRAPHQQITAPLARDGHERLAAVLVERARAAAEAVGESALVKGRVGVPARRRAFVFASPALERGRRPPSNAARI